jgi:hypothetical protein
MKGGVARICAAVEDGEWDRVEPSGERVWMTGAGSTAGVEAVDDDDCALVGLNTEVLPVQLEPKQPCSGMIVLGTGILSTFEVPVDTASLVVFSDETLKLETPPVPKLAVRPNGLY